MLSSSGQDKGPCLAIIGILSHANFSARRDLIRGTYLQHKARGLRFVFVLALPGRAVSDRRHRTGATGPAPQRGLRFVSVLTLMGHAVSVTSAQLHDEQTQHGDLLILPIREISVWHSGAKPHAFLAWAASLGEESFAYVAKMDDDSVINPHLLAERLRSLPRQRVFYGRAMPFDFRDYASKRSFPFPTKMLGMFYAMSFDLVQAIGKRSYDSLLDKTMKTLEKADFWDVADAIDSVGLGDDRSIASFVAALVPQNEWHRALPCELHNHEGHQQKHPPEHSSTWTLSNQTIVCHQVKSDSMWDHVFAAVEPLIAAVGGDCASSEDLPWLDASPAEACARWLHIGTRGGDDTGGPHCLSPPAPYVRKSTGGVRPGEPHDNVIPLL
ncbi:hypothetical protein FOA52_006469 [Chlamydomonas sp. UWO 241]|nr:hypothetical protein FOA52_006469 [Chlamydomonas sp. UWO 241]